MNALPIELIPEIEPVLGASFTPDQVILVLRLPGLQETRACAVDKAIEVIDELLLRLPSRCRFDWREWIHERRAQHETVVVRVVANATSGDIQFYSARFEAAAKA